LKEATEPGPAPSVFSSHSFNGPEPPVDSKTSKKTSKLIRPPSGDGHVRRRAERGIPQRRQLSQDVADYLRDAVMGGEIHAGEFVRPFWVASDLGVSQTPVREALMALQKEGLLIWEARRGFRVAEVSRQDVLDLFGIQAFIAGELASRAAARLSDAELEHLEGLQAELAQAAISDDVDRLVELNHRIHRRINHAAGSPGLTRFLSLVVSYVPRRFFGSIPGWPQASVEDHRRILEALRSRDAQNTGRAMKFHIEHAGFLLAEHLSSHLPPDKSIVTQGVPEGNEDECPEPEENPVSVLAAEDVG
jgi:DNA-binding GntR family transcriptional regulator